MKVSLNDVENDLIELCEDNEVMREEIKTYFDEFENKQSKTIDLKDEIEEVDETTNEIMDRVRAETKLNDDSDKDDRLYGFVHSVIKKFAINK